MEFYCDKKYLIVPASHHGQNKRVLFYVDGKLVYDFVAAIDFDEPDYEFPLNVERFMGKKIRVECDRDIDLNLRQSDSADTDYCGKYRPYAHFTAKRGWLNDPNGLTYYNGKYLMFYQHNPVAVTWENMHWGYAESDDLIHWRERDIALFPDENGTMFSGSAIVDRRNVTGLKENGNDVLLLFYTCAGSTSETAKGKPFTQNLAYSADGGNTFIKREKPLIEQICGGNRDPKIIYYEPNGTYIMALFLEGHEFALFKSKNLLDWEEFQRITLAEDAECPDFYPLAADGDKNNVKWVFSAASDRYLIGGFDGEKFTPESGEMRLNYGNNSYAAQSWTDVPDGRRIRTAFATVVIPGMPFGSVMNVPQNMSLKTVNGELRLCAEPVAEIEKLYKKTEVFENVRIEKDKPFSLKTAGKCYDITLDFAECSSYTFSLFGLDIEYSREKGTLKCLDKAAPVSGGSVRIVIDTAYAEIFAEGGSVFMGMTYIRDGSLNRLEIRSENAVADKISAAELGRFWE
ncbi:MAG: glycoside hydrolase family 32 protein [Ruminococcus sp.]|nr:glycoside hydrolase family 32 protein [Ruminococcus sp.]MCM1478386.1 glycoside hydrolase family 32 protein [Muribaculaceae bacterium]